MKSTLFTDKIHRNIDKFGAVISLACAVHCIALPLLIALLPLFGLSFLLDQTIEKVFLISTICLAAFSLCWGFVIHKKIQALLVYAAAASMIICAVFILPHHHGHENYHNLTLTSASEPVVSHHGHPQSNPFGLLLLLAGGSAIALSHMLNRHFCKSCIKCKKHHHH